MQGEAKVAAEARRGLAAGERRWRLGGGGGAGGGAGAGVGSECLMIDATLLHTHSNI